MKRWNWRLGLGALGWITLYAASADAFSTGITTASFGASGCNQCHSGGDTPTTTLSGPTFVAGGSTHTYTLTVTNPGVQTHAGLNVSVSGGALATGGTDSAQTQLFSGEIIHTSRKANVAGVTTFSFNWTAPASFTSVSMKGWGNAVDFSFSSAGDKADDHTLTITSSDPTPTPTTTASPSPTATVPPPLCPPAPQVACATPEKSSLSVVDSTDTSKRKLAFKWSGGPTTDAADFGLPTSTTHYSLCLYQNGSLHLESQILAAGTCGTKPCWAVKTKGFSYKNKDATPDGVAALNLAKGDVPGKAKIGLKAKGTNLPTPLAIPMGATVTAQIVNSDNINCWGDSWSLSEITNDGVKFKAKSD